MCWGPRDVRRAMGAAGGRGTAQASAHIHRTMCGSHCCSPGMGPLRPLGSWRTRPRQPQHRAGTAVGGGRVVPSALDPHTPLLDLWDEGSSGPQPRQGAPKGGMGSKRPDSPAGTRLVYEPAAGTGPRERTRSPQGRPNLYSHPFRANVLCSVVQAYSPHRAMFLGLIPGLALLVTLRGQSDS